MEIGVVTHSQMVEITMQLVTLLGIGTLGLGNGSGAVVICWINH